MIHATLPDLAKSGALARGPVALIVAEDAVEVDSTLRHHLDAGFRSVVLFAPDAIPVGPALGAEPRLHRVRHDTLQDRAAVGIVNAVLPLTPPGTWLYYCHNAEYLFHPFRETRTIGELTSFTVEERRDTILTYVVDLYAGDLGARPDAVCRESAHLDRSGYYALARTGRDGKPMDRQLDFFGGLRWRFEEHVPPASRRIDRVSLFRARPGLRLGADHTFNDPEYNTYACPWHHSPTAAVCSFRTAKALKRNPGSTFDIDTFRAHNSVPFTWHSQQLLDLGLMEPGQWF